MQPQARHCWGRLKTRLVHAGSKVVGLFLGTGTWNFFFFNQLCGSASLVFYLFIFFKKLLQVAGLNLCEE